MGRRVSLGGGSYMEWNLPGLNEVMSSSGVQGVIAGAGRGIASRAGGGIEYRDGSAHPWVARGYVRTTDIESARRNARENSLLKALGGGGS